MRDGDRSSDRPPRDRLRAAATVLVFIGALTAGCAAVDHVPVRLYRLDTSAVINAQLYDFQQGHGRLKAVLPDGRTLTGRYTLGVDAAAARPDSAVWGQIYGYGGAADGPPQGTGHAGDASGYHVDAVFYRVDRTAAYGTGLARDSEGHWFRVHLGRLAP